ncbi:MAG: addiction module protein [Dehalococcoidia bacterium]
MDAAGVLEQALALPEDERWMIAHELLESVPEWGPKEPGYDEAWAEEIKRRVAELDAGAPTVPWEEVRDAALARLNAVRPA